MDWLQEVEVLYECLKYNTVGAHSNLIRLPYLDLATYRMHTSLEYITHFLDLKNTATAGYFIFRVMRCYGYWFPDDVPEFKPLMPSSLNGVFACRHPEPTRISAWSVEYPQLQVRGLWSKIRTSLDIRPPRSPNPNAWIWKSRLYVRWGEAEFNQLWYLDLKDRTKWHRLTPFPWRFFALQPSYSKPIIYKDQVWFFAGRREILCFNLVAETWNSVRTKSKDSWPFDCTDFVLDIYCVYNVERYKNKMCVFGGSTYHESAFMLLDFTTLTWRRFDLAPKLANGEVTQDMPLGRSSCGSWVVEEEDTLFIMYGDNYAEVVDPRIGELYADLWSFSFITEKWTRLRICGNFPSPRTCMANAYHNALKKVIVFGGVSRVVPLSFTEGETTQRYISHHADTFIMDAESKKWKQVITKSIPAWRGCSRMLIDETDGRIYIYGGHSNGVTHREEHNLAHHAYGDIWCLDLDITGHSHEIEKQDFHKLSSFKAGIYRRCFACQKVGREYFRCQGTCGGKAIYCSKDCHRKAWKDHKSSYGCCKV